MLKNGKADLSGLMGDANTEITLRGVIEWTETDHVTKVTTRYQGEVKVDVKVGKLFAQLGGKAGRASSGKSTLGHGLVRGSRTGPVQAIGPLEAK